ncbi:DUF1796 family putative cysteine peptidase [Xanthobacter agilis]|uniref:DUF1796 family putative cysteine peptidase n=1 Tax=Xanthobacter agilis TaxID=47492 RepID=UPI00372B2AD4
MRPDSPYDLVISLGGRCDVSFQIRQYFDLERTYFFDWLITPISSVLALLKSDFADVCLRENLKIVPAAGSGGTAQTVIDVKYGFALHHEFTRTPENRISDAFEAEIENVQAKMRVLAGRVLEALDSRQRILFVRRGGDFTMPGEIQHTPDPAFATSLHAGLKDRAPTLNFDLLAMNMPAPPEEDRPKTLIMGQVHPPLQGEWPDPTLNWRGSTKSYTAHFDRLLAARA